MKSLQQQSYNEWLVVRCQLGEMAALEELVGLWQHRYFLYAMNRLGQREAAQDVTQECLLAISRSISKLADPAAFPKWSFRIVERRCIDWLRKTIRERAALAQEAKESQLLQGDAAQRTADSLESSLDVATLLNSLDPQLATLLRLYYLESLSVTEIAQVSEVPVGTIKSRLFYARKLLSQLLNQQKSN